MADLGPTGARTGDLLTLREADEPPLLAIVARVIPHPWGTRLELVRDPWGYGEPSPEELERDLTS